MRWPSFYILPQHFLQLTKACVVSKRFFIRCQAPAVHEPRATTAVCFRSSIGADDTEAVQELTPDVPGVLLLLIMTQIKCMAGVEDMEVSNKLS